MHKRQSGFSATVILILLIVVSVIGFAGWYVWHTNQNNKTTTTPKNPAPTTTVTPPKTIDEPKLVWTTYSNTEAKVTFQYPDTWKSEAQDTFRYPDGAFGGVGGSVTSPKGNILTWIYQVAGGKGGDCTPNPSDTPFTVGNKCSTKQIISVEKVRDIKAPEGTGFRNLFKDSLFITHTKYTGSDEKLSYQICLDPYYTSKTQTHDDETPTPKLVMGLLFACEYWDTGFNATYVVKDVADFNSSDAKIAEQIMRTFNAL